MSNLTFRLGRAALVTGLALTIGAGTSCMTTYDSYGRPVQSVDPGLAIAGVAAAGILGAAAANSHHHHSHGGSYGGGYYRGGYAGPYPRGYYGGVAGGYYRGTRYYRTR